LKNISAPRRLPRVHTLLGGFALGIIAYAPGVQAGKTQLTDPRLLANFTELQVQVAGAIDFVCPTLAGAGLHRDARPTASVGDHFFYSCSAMVQTANDLYPPPAGASTSFSTKVSAEELGRLLQNISPAQMNGQSGNTITRSASSLLAARLFDLRGGTRGFSVSLNGVDVPAVADAGGQRGGGASADSSFGGRLSGFVKIGGNWGKVDETVRQDPYKYDSFSVLAGADYRINDAFVAGGAVSYEDTRSRFDNSLGHVDATTWSVAGYATYSSGPWYVDGFAAYGSIDYDTSRTVFIPATSQGPALLGSATASPRGDQWTLAFGTGYNYPMTGYTLTPFARLGYIHVKNKSFSESEPITGMGLSVDTRTLNSLQSALGGTISTTVNTSMGVFNPYFTAQWVHEFKNDNPSINAKFVNDPNNQQFFIPTENPTRDYGVFILGSSATFANGFSGFLQVGAAAGLKDASNYSVTAGLRKEF
jgi:outer membrane autotransporter protein